MDKNRYRHIVTGLFIVWTAIILWGSLAPGDRLPPAGWLAQIPYFDKFVHFGFYLGEVTLLVLWLRPSRRGRVWIVLSAVACSGAIELIQGSWCGRSADWYDFAANSLGALSGIPLAAWLDRKVVRRILYKRG